MLQQPAYLLIISALFVWLAALTFYLVKTVGHYKKLTKGANGSDLAKVLEEIISKLDQDTNSINQLSKSLVGEQNKSTSYLQKSALVRFNPFEDAGGDQSFAFAMLNGENNGVVISSLHSRGSTRIYAKTVVAAKAKDHQFSKEEKEAVEKAAQSAKKS